MQVCFQRNKQQTATWVISIFSVKRAHIPYHSMMAQNWKTIGPTLSATAQTFSAFLLPLQSGSLLMRYLWFCLLAQTNPIHIRCKRVSSVAGHRPLKNKSRLRGPGSLGLWEITWGFWMIVHIEVGCKEIKAHILNYTLFHLVSTGFLDCRCH